MHCHLGDFAEYARLRRALSDREEHLARDAGAAQRGPPQPQSLERLQLGDVILIPGGRTAGCAVVVQRSSAARAAHESPRPVVLTADRQVRRLSVVDFADAGGAGRPAAAAQGASTPRNGQLRRDLASRAARQGARRGRPPAAKPRRGGADEDAEVAARSGRQLRAHPCHGCDRARGPRALGRALLAAAPRDRAARSAGSRAAPTPSPAPSTGCATLLESLGYLDGDTRHRRTGPRLRRLYTEIDLLAAECLRDGLWDGLTPGRAGRVRVRPGVRVAAGRRRRRRPRCPAGARQEALAETVHLWGRLDLAEKDHGLSFQREPDLGFAWAAYRWASGQRLERVLTESDMQAGDFVRWSKQLIDLLGQVADAAPAEGGVRQAAFSAVEAIRRGVVAYSSVG